MRRCTSRRWCRVGGGGNPEGGGGGGNPGRDNPHKGNPGGATLAGQTSGGGKPVTLARATLRRANLESWKGILGATGRATTLAGGNPGGGNPGGATLTGATWREQPGGGNGGGGGNPWCGQPRRRGHPDREGRGGRGPLSRLNSPPWPGWDVLLLLLEATLCLRHPQGHS